MIKLIKNRMKNPFTKNVFLVGGGTLFAQSANTLLAPVITRIYSPQDYGILTLYLSILTIVTIISCLKYEMAITIADSDEKAVNALVLSFSVLILIVFVSIIILFLCGDYFLIKFESGNLSAYKYFIPLGLLLTGSYQILMQWNFRVKNYKSISKTKITQSFAQNSTKILVGLVNSGPLGLILGTILGHSTGISTLSRSLFKYKVNLFKYVNRKEILWSMKRYRRFPLFLAPSHLFGILGIHLPVLFISYIYGKEIIGLYGLAYSIVSLPMNLVGKSVGDVFYGEAAKLGKSNPDKIIALSKKLFRRLILIGMIPLVILSTSSPFLFQVIFGERWIDSGKFAQILAFLVFFSLIFTPISRIFEVYEKQKHSLFVHMLRSILTSLVFIFALIFDIGPFWTVGYYVAAVSFTYFLSYLFAQSIMLNQSKIINSINIRKESEFDRKN